MRATYAVTSIGVSYSTTSGEEIRGLPGLELGAGSVDHA